MKDDTVSRAAAIDALWEIRQEEISDGRRFHDYCSLSTAVDVIKNLPSVQPQIIHCAECIHWKHSDVRKNYCEVFDWVNKAEDFCSFAERRSDGN